LELNVVLLERQPPHEKRAAALARTHLHDVLGDLDVVAAAAGGGGDVDVMLMLMLMNMFMIFHDYVYFDLYIVKMPNMIFILILMIRNFRF